MGWGSAATIMAELIGVVRPNVPDPKIRQRIYEPMIRALAENDWDTKEDCIGTDCAYDAALNALYPGDYEIPKPISIAVVADTDLLVLGPALTKAGLKYPMIQPDLGVITGAVVPDRFESLKAVPGVDSIEYQRTVAEQS